MRIAHLLFVLLTGCSPISSVKEYNSPIAPDADDASQKPNEADAAANLVESRNQGDAIEFEPGEGVLCAAAIIGLSANVGEQCIPDYKPDNQIRLRSAVARLESYILLDSDWDRQKLSHFMDKQADKGLNKKELCQSVDGESRVDFAKTTIDAKPQDIEKWVDSVTAKRGTPRWGDCL